MRLCFFFYIFNLLQDCNVKKIFANGLVYWIFSDQWQWPWSSRLMNRLSSIDLVTGKLMHYSQRASTIQNIKKGNSAELTDWECWELMSVVMYDVYTLWCQLKLFTLSVRAESVIKIGSGSGIEHNVHRRSH